MEKEFFTLQVDGRKAECLREGSVFRVQITYAPVYLELKENGMDSEWIEVEIGKPTALSKKLGDLIQSQYLNQSQGKE